MFTEEKKNSQIFQDSNHLSPTSELEVSELIKEAYKKKFPIDIHGSNSKKFIGYNVQAAKSLDFSSLCPGDKQSKNSSLKRLIVSISGKAYGKAKTIKSSSPCWR